MLWDCIGYRNKLIISLYSSTYYVLLESYVLITANTVLHNSESLQSISDSINPTKYMYVR
jgi:hypothetical protein